MIEFLNQHCEFLYGLFFGGFFAGILFSCISINSYNRGFKDCKRKLK